MHFPELNLTRRALLGNLKDTFTGLSHGHTTLNSRLDRAKRMDQV